MCEDVDISALFNLDHSTTHDVNRVHSPEEALVVLEKVHGAGHVPFWKKPPKLDSNQLNSLHSTCRDLLAICSSNNIHIFADGGTLLGAVRHQGIIPWDDDMDFCILKSQRCEFIEKCLPSLLSCGMRTIDWWYGGWRILTPKGTPIKDTPIKDTPIKDTPQCTFPFIDVFVMDLHRDGHLKYSNRRAESLWPSGLLEDDLFPLKQYKFGPLFVPGPREYTSHLNSLYGKDWQHVYYDYCHHQSGALNLKIKVKL